MSKKFGIGLLVAFVVALALSLPLMAQAQSCKYVGPTDPLALNTVSYYNPIEDEGPPPSPSATVKTIKSQKEVFYCYGKPTDVPDDKTLENPLANRDKITKGLVRIVELEIFAIIVEWSFPSPQTARGFRAVRCEKQMVTQGNGSTTVNTWVVTGCTTYSDGVFGTLAEEQLLPAIPLTAARQCGSVGNNGGAFGKSPYTGGPIPVGDPTEMNTVTIDYDDDGRIDYIKTIKVNKEVFRCFESGSANTPVIYDIELYYEELEEPIDIFPGVRTDRASYSVAYCAKKEKEALLMGCSWKDVGQVPFAEAASAGLPAALRPFVTLKNVELKQGGGQYRFEVQGYNIEGVQVQVYNLSGKQVFRAEAAGNSLSWNGLSSDGRRLANGVYLYVLTVKGTYGDIVQTKVQKLAILR